MTIKLIAMSAAASLCVGAFAAAEEEEGSGWSWAMGEGVTYDETPIVSAEASLTFDSKYLYYGFVCNKDPILTPAGEITFFDWLTFGVSAIFDVTKYGRRAGYTSRQWQYTEFHPTATLSHSFSPEDYEWLPTTVEFSIGYDYEYHPNSKSKGVTPWDKSISEDTQFVTFELALPDLWVEPTFLYERDIMRDNGTYLNLEIGHTFALIEDGEEGADPVLSFRPSISQGLGNAMRVRAYACDRDGDPLDHSGLMDTMVKGELTWKFCDFCSLSGYVAYSDFLFDRKIRDAAREYEATGSWEHSWNFVAGLALTASF